jgi:hypothetical protein
MAGKQMDYVDMGEWFKDRMHLLTEHSTVGPATY